EDLDRHKAELIDAFRAVVQETVPGLVLTVVQETVPGLVLTVVQETVPGLVRAVIQETVPDLVRAVVQETVPDLIHAIVQETETKLLSAFFSYQEHAEIKYRKLSADVTNVNAAAELRLGNLESRVIELEKRVLRGGPPQ
ncbi:MAG: hypothetical protein Q8N47_13005, partial [Bryobacterales bacterium]|nr:hypothetical protein [Bryobacterales bacterium]